MKKIVSLVLAGAFMLSLGACSGSSKASETTQATTTEATTTKAATTTTTTEETTTESTTETERVPSFDELIPKDGEIFVDLSGKSSTEIAENVLGAMRLRTGTTAESYAKRFSTVPKYTYSKGVWTFDWGKKKLKTNTFDKITITAGKDGDKIVLDQRSAVKVKFFIEEEEIGTNTYDKLRSLISLDGESTDYLKDGLAINPRRSGMNISKLFRYQKYTFKWVEITVQCDIPRVTEE